MRVSRQSAANILKAVWANDEAIPSGVAYFVQERPLYSKATPRRARIVLNFKAGMKNPKRDRWLTLLVALGLLYVGIDRMFFDRIAGSDPLARIERTLAILAGTLLIALSISLFVAAWTRRSLAAMNTNSVNGRLLVHAFSAAPGALVFGFCLVRTIKQFDNLSLTATVLFGAFLIADLLWTRREVWRLAASQIAKKAATQFLWSCIFFSMLSFGLGMAVSGWNWFSTDFMRAFNLLFWSAMTIIAI
jgi:hypothetical protein